MKLKDKLGKLNRYDNRKRKRNDKTSEMSNFLRWFLIVLVFIGYILMLIIIDDIDCIDLNVKLLLHLLPIYIFIVIVKKLL